MAEQTVLPSAQCLPLPDELNDVTAAAIANPGMIGGLLQATVPGGFKIAAQPVPLSEVEQAWPKHDSALRTVFIVNGQSNEP